MSIRRIDRRDVLRLGAGALLIPAAACSAVIPNAPALYRLDPEIALPADLPKVAWQLVVGVPDAEESLQTARIGLTRSATTLDYFADAAWPDRLPLLVQRELVDAFEDSGRLSAVARDTAAIRADFLLLTTLRDFRAHYAEGSDAAPSIEIAIGAELVTLPDRDIAATTLIRAESAAAGTSLDSIIRAFDTAAGAAFAKLVAWTIDAGDHSWSARR